MDQYAHQSLLSSIHSTDRRILDIDYFSVPTKISLLHFIGASNYFITSFGAVWDRRRVFLNRWKRVTKGYQPLVIRDAAFPYPWVKLNSTLGEMWFPVNQLVGWAFDPPTEIQPSYYLAEHPGFQPLTTAQYHWEFKEPSGPTTSRYLQFMRHVYAPAVSIPET